MIRALEEVDAISPALLPGVTFENTIIYYSAPAASRRFPRKEQFI
jgi:hypothetical protein